jgi:hypothetical protein
MGHGCSATGTAADSEKVTPPSTVYGSLGAHNARSSQVGRAESGGSVIAVICWARAPRGGITGQGVVLTDLKSLFDCQ